MERASTTHGRPGAARLALKFDTVMLPLSVVRLPGVRFRVTAHEPIVVNRSDDKASDTLAGIQAANRFVEDRVKEHPVDWFWVHKRWPDKVYAALDRPASVERRIGGAASAPGTALYHATSSVADVEPGRSSPEMPRRRDSLAPTA